MRHEAFVLHAYLGKDGVSGHSVQSYAARFTPVIL